MDLNFASALEQMEAGSVFRLANTARPAADYVLAEFLPEVNKPTYQAKSGSMIVRSIMAGLAAMDSPYPPGSAIEISKFDEETAKIANDVRLPESALRQLQDFIMRMMGSGADVDIDFVMKEALQFLDKVIIQGHLDTMEMLRGRALATGAILWTFNKKTLDVNYGIPPGNILANRTGTAGYGGSASVFWADMAALDKLLRYSIRARVMHISTLNMIVNNPANNIEIVSQSESVFQVRRLVSRGGNTVPSSDTRETLTLIGYGLEGDIIDPLNPAATIPIPFYPLGKISVIANNVRRGYQVGQGSTPPPDNAVGYTHIGPTVEGGGRMGRWARLLTPEQEPWTLVGQGVTNGLPVIEAPEKIGIASTEMV